MSALLRAIGGKDRNAHSIVGKIAPTLIGIGGTSGEIATAIILLIDNGLKCFVSMPKIVHRIPQGIFGVIDGHAQIHGHFTVLTSY